MKITINPTERWATISGIYVEITVEYRDGLDDGLDALFVHTSGMTQLRGDGDTTQVLETAAGILRLIGEESDWQYAADDWQYAADVYAGIAANRADITVEVLE